MFLRVRKTVITVLVALFALVCALLGVSLMQNTQTAYAETTATYEYNSGDDFVTVWNNAASASSVSVNSVIKMNDNAHIDGGIEIASGQNVTLDLNGNVLRYMGVVNSKYVISVAKGGKFTLNDSGADVKHDYYWTSVYDSNIVIVEDAVGGSGVYGGVITSDFGNSNNGGLEVAGTFIMNGGNIMGHLAKYNTYYSEGGAVCVSEDGKFVMNNGKISGNIGMIAGGVCVYDGTFEMNGGSITANRTVMVTLDGYWASHGAGGVFVSDKGNFRISGAINIMNNKRINKYTGDDYNVYLQTDAIQVIGPLTDGTNNASIALQLAGSLYSSGGSDNYFEPDSGTFVFTSGYGVNNKDGNGNFIAPSTYFISQSYGRMKCLHLENGEVKFSEPELGEEYKRERDYHWHECLVCGKHYDIGLHTSNPDDGDCTTDILCSKCEYVIVAGKEHDFTGRYYKDEDGHWHVCTRNGCTQTDEKVAHSYTYTDKHSEHEYVCSICGYKGSEPHTFEGDACIYCGAAGNYKVSSAGEEDAYFADLASAYEKAEKSGTATITLLHNVEENTFMSVQADINITLDLNGFVLKFIISRTPSNIEVYGVLTLTDNNPDAVHYYTENAKGTYLIDDSETDGKVLHGGVITNLYEVKKGAVYVSEGGTFTMNGGNISGNSVRSYGGGVYLDGGTFEMKGGCITGNSAGDPNSTTVVGRGGGVYVPGGTFTMNGGTISDNCASNYGGGVYMSGGGTFEMNDGNISDNVACIKVANHGADGGGVYVSSGTFTMNGGSVTGNSAGDPENKYIAYGGGVYSAGGTFEMNRGSITGNRASREGGGVYVYNNSTFTMNGGTISDNNASNGGGVCIRGMFEMSDGSITVNSAKSNGGGVYLDAGMFEMSGGSITGNSAKNGGGVVVLGTFEMSGGSITGNSASSNGGGVYVVDDTFKISGAVDVSGNDTGEADNDVYLAVSSYSAIKGIITVTGALTDGRNNAHIGVTLEEGYTGVFTSAYGANNRDGNDNTVPPSAYFFSNDTATPCVYVEGDEVGLGAHNVSAEWVIDGTHHWHPCLNGRCIEQFGKASHTPNPDDGDCTTEITCSACGYVTTAAQPHDFSGECVDIDANGHRHTCTHYGCVQISEKIEHTASPDDGDCTTDITCSACGYVLEKGKYSHWFNYYQYDEDGHWRACIRENCVQWESEKVAHTPRPDDGNCTTPITCTDCGYVFVQAKTHDFSLLYEANDTGHTYRCANEGCNKIDYLASHTPNPDDGDCTTAITCSSCGYVTTAAKSHVFNTSYLKDEDGHWHVCTNLGCSRTDTKVGHVPVEYSNCTWDTTCRVCNYLIKEAYSDHDFSGEYDGQDRNGHWHICNHEGCAITDTKVEHTVPDDDGDCTTSVNCTVCGYAVKPAYSHNFTGKYHSDEDGHWHVCLYTWCSQTDTKAEHDKSAPYSDNPELHGYICNDCGYVHTEDHTFEDNVCVDCGAEATAKVTVNNADKYYVKVINAWNAAAGSGTAKVTLLADYNSDVTLQVANDKNLTLDLNGRVLRSGIFISGGTFTLEDGNADAVHYYTKDADGLYVIDDGNTDGDVLYGGAVTGSSSYGVNLYYDGTFTMNGGNISGNASGGVNLFNGGTFEMNGGNISGNKSSYGGGVYVNGTFTMNGGNITDNSASDGGGVYLNDGTFEMNGGTISDNNASRYGGGVYVRNTFEMNDGSITDNSASYGGGVYVDGMFEMNGGTISENNASGYGGGVYVRNTFEMNGGSITDNSAGSYGGGAYVDGTIKISGAINISGNKKGDADNDVYVKKYEVITVVGALTDGTDNAHIGVIADSDYLNADYENFVTSGYGANNKDADGNVITYSSYFFFNIQFECEYLGENEVGISRYHKASDEWSKDETRHWQICKNCRGAELNVGQHYRRPDDKDCTTPRACICGYVYVAAEYTEHDFTGEYKYNVEYHWYECTHDGCVQTYGKAGHTRDAEGYCNVCGMGHVAKVTAEGAEEENYFFIDDAFTAALAKGTAQITLLADAYTENNRKIGADKNITLDLNGFVLDCNSYVHIDVEEGGKFNLIDNNPTAVHYYTVIDGEYVFDDSDTSGNVQYGGIFRCRVYVYDSSTFEMSGGTVAGRGYGVLAKSGSTFEMSGGNVSFVDSYGVKVESEATFIMSGGTISNNKYCGVDVDGTFEMSDGTVSGNREGVCVIGGGQFIMSGGSTVSGNKEGGVKVNNSTFTMNDGTISDNVGYGVYLAGSCEFKMYDGSISDNSGFGIKSSTITFESGYTFEMRGGSISGNADSGVYIYRGTFTMYGGSITGNTASEYGGGVYSWIGTFTMYGGSITGNSAKINGGGVYGYSTFELKGAINISGNKMGDADNDLYLNGSTKTINVLGALTDGTDKAHIGVTFDTSHTGEITSGYGEIIKDGDGNVIDPIEYFFFNDSNKCPVLFVNTRDKTEVKAGAHTTTDEWLTDDVYHWQVCEKGCAEANKAAHGGKDDKDCTTALICSTCGYEITAAQSHIFTGEYVTDADGHWHVCANDGCTQNDKTPHSFVRGVCVDCGMFAAVKVTADGVNSWYSTINYAWDAVLEMGTAKITLLADAETSTGLETEEVIDITLDLNGFVLRYAGKAGSVISMSGGTGYEKGSKLTLEDSNAGAVHYYTKNDDGMYVIDDGNTGGDVLYGGVITGGTGYGVYLEYGTIIINGGNIVGNVSGGTFSKAALFKMTDGMIAGNNGTGMRTYGGYNTFEMSGGTIADNSGYGVSTAYAKMSGGTITGNRPPQYGGSGGMYCYSLEMSGGSITDNFGYGVNATTFTMTGGSITGNTVGMTGGGGVNIQSYGSFKISGAVNISGNRADDADKDLYLNGKAKTIFVLGALTDGTNNAHVGVTLGEGYDALFTSGYGVNNKDANGNIINPTAYFYFNDASLCAALSDGEAVATEHSATEWVVDGDVHWQVCAYGCGLRMSEIAEHVAQADDGDCTTAVTCECGYEFVAAQSHDFTGAYQSDEEGHWHVCQHEGCTQTDKTAHSGTDDNDCTTAVLCSACGYEITAAQSHDFTGAYVSTGTQHWHICTHDGCTKNDTKTAHSGTDDNDCTTAVLCVCGYELTSAQPHDFTGAYQSDGNGHWHVCTHDGCTQTDIKVNHVGTDDNDCTTAVLCSVCGYEITAAQSHDFTGEHQKDTAGHWHVCAHDGCTQTDAKAAHDGTDDNDCTTAVLCSACGYELTSAQSHDFTGAYQKDTAGHWHICAHDGCTQTDSKAAHGGADDNDCTTAVLCSACGYEITAAQSHDFTGAYQKDSAGHWHICAHDGCAQTDTKVNHGGTDDNDCTTAVLCSDCGYVIRAAQAHNFIGAYKSDEEGHWHVCTHAGCTQVDTKVGHVGTDDDDCTTAVLCSDCGYEITTAQSHDFSGEYLTDDEGHWHVCTHDGCAQKDTKVNHGGTDDDDCSTAVTCVCGYEITAARSHDFNGAYQSDDDGHWHVCTHEGCTQTDTKVNHTYDEEVVDEDYLKSTATCSEKALYFMSCECGYVGTETFEYGDALGHDYGEWETTLEPTCSAEGNRRQLCSRCNNVKTEAIAIEPDAHDYDEGVVTTQPTCEDAGVKTFTCSHNSAHSYTEEIAVLGHDYGEWETTLEPTCSAEGSRRQICSRCNDVKTEAIAIDSDAHDYDEGVVTTQPTCEDAGVKTFTCSHNSAHSYTEEIAALGHDYGEWTVTKQATDKEYGEEQRVCSRDGAHIETRQTPKLEKAASGLSAGAIAGISIGSLASALCAAYVIGYFALYRKGLLLTGKIFSAIYSPMNSIFNKH